MRASTPEPIWFHGAPDSLEALVPAGPELPSAARLELPKLELEGEAHCSEAGAGLWWVHACLPRRTPAGTHAGRLSLGDEQQLAVRVVIHPHHEVVLTPTQLVVQARPGQQTEHHFVVINQGNAALVLARDGAFGLLREDGLEDALSAAYRAKATGLDRVAIAADALAERHALVVARVEGGPLTVEPEAYRRFDVTLRWPRDLEPGRSYEGTWTLANSNLSVEVSVLEPGADDDVIELKRS